jgi:hypothetical protein
VRTLVPLLSGLLIGCGASEIRPVDAVGFLAGTWSTDDGGFRTVERWQPLPDGDLLGSGSVHRDGAMLFAEALAIVPKGDKLAYVAWPNDKDAVVYDELERIPSKVTFANGAHDFPRRITYARVDPDTLEATATGVEADGRPREETWRLTRVTVTSTR